jgi:putative transposase
MPHTRRPYPSDLSDEEWVLLRALLESPDRRGWRPPKWPTRRVADAVFYLLRSGCAWRMLPRGNTRPLADRLLLPLLEVASGREAAPGPRPASRGSARRRRARPGPERGGEIDTQEAVKGTGVGGPERGYDGAAKRLSGRKRHLLVDTAEDSCWAPGSMGRACTTATARGDS